MKTAKKILSLILAVAVVASCWIWLAPEKNLKASAEEAKDHYLFAYFTGTSKEGQTIHLAVSEDGYNYTALRNNEPVIIPSKGVGNVRDPYIWYNEQDNYYYILATDLDFTDGGGNYSVNSQSFIIWRSKDLVNWYDETFIDVSKMSHLIGDTRNMTAVWAPQVLWDGSAYVVYFSLNCNATASTNNRNAFEIVYLKTTDLLDANAYYEYGKLLNNFLPNTGGGTDGVIDADIIHNPGDGKYYLFYKTENNSNSSPPKTIHYAVGETPTGPFVKPAHNKWQNCGFSVFPNYTVGLEGCNSFFDNDGNLIMYVDEFEHKNLLGESEAYFHIAKSDGYDFTKWSYPNVNSHNINSLSPRHGSVVKITGTEYNRLLQNSYNISSSSYPETEVLEDHLVARYFTTSNVLDNVVVGQPDLKSSTGITMTKDSETGEYYASFDSTNGGWAEGEFANLFRKTGGLNYEDGFTITFKAMLQPNSATNNENNDRIYEIANIFGDEISSNAYYTSFSPGGGGHGSYIQAYNGPVESGKENRDWIDDKDNINRDDECFHEYIVSYANGNVMMYVDGELVISKNRFTSAAPMDASWYQALGSNATMRIGKSGWDADPLFKGRIADLCIYDCSMSYYDAKSLSEDFALEEGWVGAKNYTGITTKVPTFQNTDAARMQSLPNASEHFSNILYTSNTVRNFDGNHMSTDSAAWQRLDCGDTCVALYYPETTVLLYDGVNDAIMPVSFGVYCENSRKWKSFLRIYPTTGPGSTADLGELEISTNWAGWYNNGDYYNCIVEHEDGYIGRNSTTTSWAHITDKEDYDCHWGAPLKVNGNKINFGDSYYKKFNLTWQIVGGDNRNSTEKADHSANITSDNDIYVINFKPILDLRKSITEAEYNSIVNNTNLCIELREKYAAAVKSIRTMNPTDFGFDFNEAAAITATKALSSAIGEAIGTYNGVMAEIERETAAGTFGHQKTNFEARPASCEAYGLTSGSYCHICGEILEEQEILATLPHTFKDVTVGGVKFKECTVCGVRIEYQPSEARYENLFSFIRWAESASNKIANDTASTVSTNLIDGTITIVNKISSEVYTRGHFDGKDFATVRDFGSNCIPVTGGGTYVVEATSLASSTSHGEVFIFQYNKDGYAFSTIPTVLSLNPGQTSHNYFTVDKNAAFIELRFDCNNGGKTITYSQIGVYTKESFDRFGATTADARLGFYPGDSKDLCYPNPADGYTFDGWYTKSGIRIDNVNQLNIVTTVVYGKWIKAGYNVVYDSIFSFSSWAKSSCNQLWYDDGPNGERYVTKEGIFADASKGTLTITNDADTNNFARTNYWSDNGNVHKMPIKQNTNYIIEYTAESDDGAKPSICAYITGGTAPEYPESGPQTSYGLGKQYFSINSGNNTTLTLRFDNVEHGSTVTFSNIAVYEESASDPAYFRDHAQNITNRQYMRYYPTKMGIGDVFEYTPTRPGYTFATWMRDTDGDNIGDSDMKNLPDSFVVEQNWHLFSTWTENSYNIAYDANGGTGSILKSTHKYTANATLAKEGFTKTGYKLAGWSTIPTATVAQYQLGQTTSRLNGDANGTTTLYAVWVKADLNVTFDNLIDFSQWTKTAGNGTVSDVTATGMTVTCTTGEGTTSSPYFPVTPGKSYRIDIDITGVNGNTWDVYIFFCDANGNWIDFKDGPTNRYSNNTTHEPVFTAPNKDSVVKAQIRLDANNAGTSIRFENIRVFEDTGVKVSPVNKIVSPGEPFGNLPVPTKTDYAFAGWYDANGNKYTATTTVPATQATTINLFSRWLITDAALKADVIVVDFGTPVEFDVLANDAGLIKELAEKSGSTYKFLGITADETSTPKANLDGSFGSFAVKDFSVAYTPESVMNGTDSVYYHIQVTTNAGTTTVKSKITVAPASNILYEENLFVQKLTGLDWTRGTAAAVNQTSSSADVYGYDSNTAGYNKLSNYSGGTAYTVTVNSDNKRSKNLTFDFTGEGFDLNGACGPDTGVLVVTLRDNKTNKIVKSYVIDTYYADARYANTLYQVPIINEIGLDYSDYTIQIIASYLPSMSGACNSQVTTQSVNGMAVSTASGAGNAELREALAEIGLDYVLDTETVEVVWFDENSVLNGGDGANTVEDGTVSTQGVTSLRNVIDSVRVYKPILNGDEYYISSEKNAQYYNVVDNLVNGKQDGIIPGLTKFFAYVSGNDNAEITVENYNSIGPKDELYLTNREEAVAFTINGFNPDTTRVMISLRAASGTPTAKFGTVSYQVKSNTEMYYDITDSIKNGTVTIQNVTANTLLSVGSIKVTSTVDTFSFVTTELDVATASFMMSAPATIVEPNTPNTEPEAPTDPEKPSNDNSIKFWFVRFFNWLTESFAKVFNIIRNVLGF
ncbi:MAG: InlB B-repeat-containing protein [Acutalibacteraceae bacterium]|nr:InlB B-repeat-containing protein [Acutalibacteraceae bacterium]